MLFRLFQSIRVGITMSFVEMTSHMLRSLLSILGVMLGVASLVAMLTLVGGVDTFLKEKMGHWAGSVWFWSQWDPPIQDKLQWSRSPKMRFSDGHYLANESKEVGRFYPSIQRRDVMHVAGISEKVTIKGVDTYTLQDDMRNMKLDTGRWFNDREYEDAKLVCLVSWLLAERIHNEHTVREPFSLLGEKCMYGNKYFTIIGIFAPIDPDFKPRHMRRSVYIPIATLQKHVTGLDPDPGSLRISILDPTQLVQQTKNVSRLLKSRHRGVEDFEYHAAEWLEEIRSILQNASFLMTVISVISLIVGGLSIMNVMLSSISERIFEIGIRKALGAKSLQIFIQFITESAILSVLGGLLGIALGMAPLFFKEGIKKATEGSVVPTVLASHIIVVCGIIVGIGLVFGLYPAIKASRMNPIAALRYE